MRIDAHGEYTICDNDLSEELSQLGTAMAALLADPGCLEAPPCAGATAGDLIVEVTGAEGTTSLAPGVEVTYRAGPLACP